MKKIRASVDPWELALDEISDTTKKSFKQESADSNLESAPTSSATPKHVRIDASKVNVGVKSAVVPSSVDSRKMERQTTQTTNEPSGIDPEKTQTVDSSTSENAQRLVEQTRAESNFVDVWYNDKPALFWTFVLGGYALSVFLAGILFAIILTS